ncbi:MAG: hypothetical protein K2X82_30440 [Gemmataceae bacterium]|nr:hypothetical protein [Gemmataceae bacterium]
MLAPVFRTCVLFASVCGLAAGGPARAGMIPGRLEFMGSYFVRNDDTGRDDRFTDVTVFFGTKTRSLDGLSKPPLLSIFGPAAGEGTEKYTWEAAANDPGIVRDAGTSLRHRASTETKGAKAEITITRVTARDNRVNLYTDFMKIAGWTLTQSGDPMVSLSLTNSFGDAFQVRDFSYQVQGGFTPLYDLDYPTGGLDIPVPGAFDLAPGGSAGVIRDLSMGNTQVLRFQGKVYNSPGDPDDSPAGMFVYQTTTIQSVPGPSSLALLGVGAAVLAGRRLRRTPTPV